MDVSHILEHLNDKQREAVTSEKQHLMVLAGAGSGKTRVLVHKIAWEVEALRKNPATIMAVTFTNKAAAEMRSRIEELLEAPMMDTWVGTFHGLAHRMLKRFHKEAGLTSGFTILDSDDQLRIIKRIAKEMSLDEASWPSRQSQWQINSWKDEGFRSAQVDDHGDHFKENINKIYKEYEAVCLRDNLVDFGELLLRSYEVVRDNPSVRTFFHSRFKSILVDEFQDTNTIQYNWLLEIASDQATIIAVGDDDQSIYGWRGAKVENVDSFIKTFDDTEVVRLEQNYRSTNIILGAANALIENNTDRLGKNLWTEKLEGEQIVLYQAYNEQDEARFVADVLRDWMGKGEMYEDAAVLYRSNAQSRALEEALLRASIPYRIYGGQRFYERMEIKNAIAYLKIIFNHSDNPAFERSISNPTRGVGEKTLAKIRGTARQFNISYIKASAKLIDEGAISGRGGAGLRSYLEFIARCKEFIEENPLSDLMEEIIKTSGLVAYHAKEPGEKGKTRVENLQELVSATTNFEQSIKEDKPFKEIAEQYLDMISLDSGDRQASEHDDAAQLMTLHSAKGLEFKLVIMTGLEESLFPHGRSMENPAQLEEERRLCYVGITRAMEKLYITHAESRRLHGSDTFNPPSRFLREIPKALINEIRPRAQTNIPYNRKDFTETKFEFEEEIGIALGQRVAHKTFGEGVVLNYEGSGEAARVQINFSKAGTKWLVMAYANLEKL
ncbi:DNA helicase II [Gammaproteobacteria bacterium]|jgi:DNA helicase-2/ATP-dependent DNA helicase PcrA|nr:DNA helicase II [Gammaproteobacteria bacterium]MDA8955612.1 DNA helicase II [Gammaproteobacteria bacterium]MDA9102492.1 DNA helicase II [Gammaproteobacteria bacterium]MDA9331064.1 DNA helicase II [Gammaproteobacteria bacterium]MDB4158983.1 DNA helicase II [Gammaproteobacteria bacterium]